MRALLIGLLSCVLPATARADADPVTELPLLAVVDGPTPVQVRGRLPAGQARAMVALARAVHADVNRRFVAASRARRGPVALCLFATSRDYQRFAVRVFGAASSPLGFYDPSTRIAVVNLERGAGNLRHELAHPLLGDDFPDIPDWINEGIGALYGTSVPGRGGRFRFLVNYRLRDLQQAIRAGELPSIDELVTSGYDDVHGEQAATYYALGRYLLLYLEQRGDLERFYRGVRAAAGDPDEQRALLAALVDYPRFVAWAARLRR